MSRIGKQHTFSWRAGLAVSVLLFCCQLLAAAPAAAFVYSPATIEVSLQRAPDFDLKALAKLSDLAQGAIDEASVAWSKSVSIARGWFTHDAQLEVILLDETTFEVVVSVRANVDYQTVLLGQGDSDLSISLTRRLFTRDVPDDLFADVCQSTANAALTPPGKVRKVQLLGSPRVLRTPVFNKGPFYEAEVGQECHVSVRDDPACLAKTGHPRSWCVYHPPQRDFLTLEQAIVCVCEDSQCSCQQQRSAQYLPDLAPKVTAMLQRDMP